MSGNQTMLGFLEGSGSADYRNASADGAGTKCSHQGAAIADLNCINTYKVDSQIFSTMITSGVAGVLCLAAFCFLQTFISVYKGRLLSPQVAIKPPVYTGSGVGKYFHWIWVTLSLKEKELLATAGMDALMFERLIVFGLQLMAPVTILSCAVLIPVHASSRFLATSTAQLQSNLMGLTMSNIYPGSSVLWLHFTFVWGYCLYAMWLLDRHYQWYVLLRQQYITHGDSIGTWLGYMPKQRPQALRNDSTLVKAPASPTQQQLLNPALGYARCTRSDGGSGPAVPELQLAGSAPVVNTLHGSGTQGLDYSQSQQRMPAAAEAVQMAEIRPKTQQPTRQSVFASAMSTDSDFFDPSSTNTSTSPADSRYTYRQSSLKTLLPSGKVQRSSSQHLHPHAVTFTPGVDTGCLEGAEAGSISSVPPAAQAVHSAHSIRSTRNSATGFAEHLKRIGSFAWKASSGYNGLEQQLEWQRRQRQHQRQREAAAAAVAAAEQLGADEDWWAYKTGDPLLDRHVVQVDIDGDLAWPEAPGPPADRLHLWWELASADANTAAQAAAEASSIAASGHTQPGKAGSNISAVPGTCLLFDKRSLRARKPSVRFRNTVHVQSLQANLLPLHVSSYAVLVTDVPGCDGSDARDDDEYADERFARHRQGLLSRILQTIIWGWPCLLSQQDLNELSSVWHDQSFRHKSMQMNEGMRQLILQQQEAAGVLSQPGQQAIESRQQPTSTSSTIAGIHNQHLSDKQCLVEQTFKQLFKDDLHAVIPVRDFQAVDELLRQWDQDLQKYIQARALLQLRIERERRCTSSGFYLQDQQHRETKRSFAANGSSGSAAASPFQLVALGSGTGGDSPGNKQQLPVPAVPRLSVRTDMPVQQKTASCTDYSSMPRAHASLSHAVTAGADAPAQPDRISLSAMGSDFVDDEVCRTPRLEPLQPHPVIPDNVMTRPRLVTRDEGENGTAFGKICSAVVGILATGKSPGEGPDTEASNDVDAVAQRLEEQRQALVDLEASILEAQKEVLSSPDTGSFIVLFKTPAAATLAARSSVFPQSINSLETFKVQPAPSPEDVLWQNLWKTPATKRDESLRCLFWYALLFLVPTGIFTAALNSISYSICNSTTVGPQMSWFCLSHLLQFLFTIILPMVLLMLWQNAVIPSHLYKLELRRGAAVSLSGMEHNILLIYVGWELVNLFLGGVLSASLTSQIKMLADNPEQWATLLGAAFPNSSNFFLNYVIARAFMMNLFRLIMPHGGMWRWIGQMLFTGAASFNHAATERYRSFIIYPASIRYGREPGLILLILLMGVAYSVAAPLITPFVLAYFCTAYLVWRYQMIYVCVRCYESGGKMWPVYFVIVLWCLGLFVVFSSCILIFKKANLQGVLVLPLLPAMYMFARYCTYSYSSRVEYPPLWLANDAPRTEIDPLVYTPPCLQPHAQGWYFEMGKAWVRWGSPAYLDPNI